MDWQAAFWTLLGISVPAVGTLVAAVWSLRTDRNGYRLSYEREKAVNDRRDADDRAKTQAVDTANRVLEGMAQLMKARGET